MVHKDKVTLMYPNFDWTTSMSRTKWYTHPYNVCLLASMIREEYDVDILDSNLNGTSQEDFARFIQDRDPDILGISVHTNEYVNAGLVAAKIAKENNPNVKIIAGGVGAMANPDPLIENPNIDGVLVGEGEYAFRELCDFIRKDGPFPKAGVLYKKGEKIIGSGRVDFIQDLDALPLPAYDLVDFMRYATIRQRESIDRPRELPYARMITSRGCPLHCCFCEVGTITGRKMRYRSLENVCKEIEWLIQDYGIKSLAFDDDNLIINKERAKDLFRMMIDRKYNLKWKDLSTAIYCLDEEMLDLMKESGCASLSVAIDNGVERVLRDIIHKPVDLKKSKEIVKQIKKRDIDLSANFVIGFPGETWEEIRATIKYAEELGDLGLDYVKLFIATPLPNTELYRMAKEGGYLKEGFSFDHHLWSEGQFISPEFRPQDLKIIRAYEWDRLNFSTPEKRKKIAEMMDVTEERLDEIRKDTIRIANP